MESTIGTIIVAIISATGTIITAIINKRTEKKVKNIDEVNKKLDFMRSESKQDMINHTLDSDKTYLINFLSELENRIPKSEVQIKRTYEIYDRYTKNGGNSYVHDKWDECRSKGLL